MAPEYGRDMISRAWGMARSLAMYHGIPGRHPRMMRFYREFLRPGDLGFDIGAHVGSRVRPWRRLGARVLAIEPQPDFVRVLRLFFGRDPHVSILPVAVGASIGQAQLALSSATPTVSSLSQGWIESVATDPGFARVRWDRRIDVPLTTLDSLIAEHGEPAFCKIDVEGFEGEVLAGLTRPLRALSFEYLPAAHDSALAALDRVEHLGQAASGYQYNYAPIETMRFASRRWLDAADLVRLLEHFRPAGRSGDVYTRATRA